MREGAADEWYQLALSALRVGYLPALSAKTGNTCERTNYKSK